MAAAPPAGTAAEVKQWMGSDPDRARAVIDAENQSDSPRVTLIAAAEAVIAQSKEEPVSETSTTPEPTTEAEDAPTWEDLEPKQEPGINLSLADASTEAYPVEVLTTDEDFDREAVDVAAGYDPDAEPEVLDSEPVTSLQLVAGTPGAVLVINGTAYGLNANAVSTLNRLVNKATAAVYH